MPPATTTSDTKPLVLAGVGKLQREDDGTVSSGQRVLVVPSIDDDDPVDLAHELHAEEDCMVRVVPDPEGFAAWARAHYSAVTVDLWTPPSTNGPSLDADAGEGEDAEPKEEERPEEETDAPSAKPEDNGQPARSSPAGESIPPELRERDRWVIYRLEDRDGKETKVPYRADRPADHAAVDDPNTWTDFKTAVAAFEDGKADGVGFVLGDGIVGIDLDHCVDPESGEVEEWAMEIIQALDSYTEISPSGTGVHVLVRGTLPAGRRRKGPIEMYSDGRYFTMTGRLVGGVPGEIQERTAELGTLHARVFGKNGGSPDEPPPRPPPPSPLDLTDRELIERAQKAKSGSKFSRLWAGDTTGYDSHSEADLALVNLLAFWCRGDTGRMDRLFRASGLMRPKWKREDYRQHTMATALDGRTDFYEPGRIIQGRGARSDAGGSDPSRASGTQSSPGQRSERPTNTDTGNAARLIALHGDELHYIPPWGKWIAWDQDEGRWTIDYKDVRIRELAKDVGHQIKLEAARIKDKDISEKYFKFAWKSLNSRGVSGMVNLARGVEGVPLDYERLDANGWLLGVENGVVDLKTGRLRPADPGDLMTLQCPVKWNEGASAPRWERAMKEWFPDEEMRAYVKRVAGSALVGVQRDHILVIHYGVGRNGKGTHTRAIQHVLGPYAGVIHLSLLVQTKHSEHDTVKAELFRKRLAIASETERRVKLNESSVKNLTGGDRITARRMREDPWEFDPTHSLWLQTNHLPEIAGRDRGMWSRIRVVKWEAVFEDADQQDDLDEQLRGEAPGILRWLVEGCLEWQDHGLDEPDQVVRDTLDYRKSEDTFTRFENDVGLEFSDDLEIQAGELQDILTDWAAEEGVRAPRQEIGDWLRENGCEKKQKRIKVDGKTKRPRFWIRVGIREQGHETEQTNALA